MKTLKFLGIVISVIIMANQECESPDPDPVFDYQTEFVDIIVTPDTVAVGDTVLVHAIIEDSLNNQFKFDWSFTDPIPVNGVIDGNKIRWKATKHTNNTGSIIRIRPAVKADNGDTSKDSPIQQFDIYIQHLTP